MNEIDGIKIVKNVPNWNKDNKVTDLEFLNNIDYRDLDNLNQALIKTAISTSEINKKLSKYERAEAKYEIEYKRKYRYELTNSNLATESKNKLNAEIKCEDLEMKILYCKQIIGELKRISNSLRMHLEIIETLGNNVRKEMGL